MDKEQILIAALKLAETRGYHGVLKRHIADSLKCSMGTINYHYGTMVELRREMVAAANILQHTRIMRAVAKNATRV